MLQIHTFSTTSVINLNIKIAAIYRERLVKFYIIASHPVIYTAKVENERTAPASAYSVVDSADQWAKISTASQSDQR